MEDTEQGVKLSPAEILFTYQGRIGPGTFWWYYLLLLVIGVSVAFSVAVTAPDAYDGVAALLVILNVWTATALVVKRLHDSGRHGAMVFILLIPLVNVIWLIVLGTAPTEGPNQYGPRREYRNTTSQSRERAEAASRPRNSAPKSMKWASAKGIDSVTDPETLRKAASDADWQTRAAVAANPNTPIDVLEKLSKNPGKGARIAVIRNPRTPRTVVEYMAEHAELPSVQRAANERLKTGNFDTDEELEESETDDEPEISEGADAIEPIPPNLLDHLERLAGLYKQGMLSEEEFNLLKSRLIH